MKFKVDENLPAEIAEILRHAGHDACTVHDQFMTGEPDSFLSIVCQKEGRVIVTLDIGFSDVRTYKPSDFPGIIVLRLKKQDKNHVLVVFQTIIPSISEEELDKKLWIVDETKIRIRE